MIYTIITHYNGNGLPNHDPNAELGLEQTLNDIAHRGGRVLNLLATCVNSRTKEILYTIVYEVYEGGRFING